MANRTSRRLVQRHRARAVMVEFNRYIAAGDLEQAKRRIAALQAKADQSGGYMGMYL